WRWPSTSACSTAMPMAGRCSAPATNCWPPTARPCAPSTAASTVPTTPCWWWPATSGTTPWIPSSAPSAACRRERHRAVPRGPAGVRPASRVRVERRKGEVARLLIALPAPAGSHPDHPALRLASTLLGDGRTSRLQHALVEDEQLCVWAAADLSEGLDASLM